MHKFLIDSIKTKQNANGDQEVDSELKAKAKLEASGFLHACHVIYWFSSWEYERRFVDREKWNVCHCQQQKQQLKGTQGTNSWQ